MTAYLDASSFTTLILKNEGWAPLQDWTSRQADLALSDFGWGEFISAMSLRFRRGLLTYAEAASLMTDARSFAERWARIRVRSRDIAGGTELVAHFDLKLRLPDAIHIAVAQRLGATLVTGDHRQAAAAKILGLAVQHLIAGPHT